MSDTEWKKNSRLFEESMMEDILEGVEYRMRLEGLDTKVLEELKQVFF